MPHLFFFGFGSAILVFVKNKLEDGGMGLSPLDDEMDLPLSATRKRLRNPKL